MPSRKRVKIKKTSAAGAPKHDSEFPTLPAEVWLEILSYYLPISDEKISSAGAVLPSRYLLRYETIRALSQTCRSIRRFFLPLLWERIEACASPLIEDDTGYWDKEHVIEWEVGVAEALMRQCAAVVDNPELRLFVR